MADIPSLAQFGPVTCLYVLVRIWGILCKSGAKHFTNNILTSVDSAYPKTGLPLTTASSVTIQSTPGQLFREFEEMFDLSF